MLQESGEGQEAHDPPPVEADTLTATPKVAEQVRACGLEEGRLVSIVETGIEPTVLVPDLSIPGREPSVIDEWTIDVGDAYSGESIVHKDPLNDVICTRSGDLRRYGKTASINGAIGLARPGQWWQVIGETRKSSNKKGKGREIDRKGKGKMRIGNVQKKRLKYASKQLSRPKQMPGLRQRRKLLKKRRA